MEESWETCEGANRHWAREAEYGLNVLLSDDHDDEHDKGDDDRDRLICLVRYEVYL